MFYQNKEAHGALAADFQEADLKRGDAATMRPNARGENRVEHQERKESFATGLS